MKQNGLVGSIVLFAILMVLSTALSEHDGRPADGPLTYGFPFTVYNVPAVELDCMRYNCEPRIQYANIALNAVFWLAVSLAIVRAYSAYRSKP